LLGFAEGDHLGEDAAVLVQEEIFGLEIFDGGVEGVVVEDYGTEDGTLGIEIVGERLFEDGFGGHARFCVRFIFAYDNTNPFCRARLVCTGCLLMQIFSGGEDDCLGSTESLFAAWAHCEGKIAARQLV